VRNKRLLPLILTLLIVSLLRAALPASAFNLTGYGTVPGAPVSIPTLLTNLGSCAQQGKAQGCILPPNVQDLAASLADGALIETALTDGTSIPVDASLGVIFTLAPRASGHTIANPTNATAGQQLDFLITQPQTGGPFTVAWDTGYGWVNGSSPVLNQLAGSTTEVKCTVVTTAPTMLCYGPVNSATGQRFTARTITAPNCFPFASQTATFQGASSANIMLQTNAINVSCPLTFTTTGTLPTNFATGTTYYVVSLSTLTITVAATPGGAAIVAGSAGFGTQSAVASGAMTTQGLSNGISLFTPATTGITDLSACFTVVASGSPVAGDGIQFELAYGMGTGPANGTNIAGVSSSTAFPVMSTWKNAANPAAAANVAIEQCTPEWLVGPLVPGVNYWADVVAQDLGHSGVTGLSNAVITAREIR
jgi:hypothetical protein